MTNTNNERIKEFLLEWLIRYGRDVVWNIPVSEYTMEEWSLFNLCQRYGYIDDLRDPFSKHQNNRITDEGMDFLQRRKA